MRNDQILFLFLILPPSRPASGGGRGQADLGWVFSFGGLLERQPHRRHRGPYFTVSYTHLTLPTSDLV